MTFERGQAANYISPEGIIPTEVIVRDTYFLHLPAGVIEPIFNPVMPPKSLTTTPEFVMRVVERNTNLTIYEEAMAAVGSYQGQCINFLKHLLGIEGTLGYAGNIKPNTDNPTIYDGVLINGNHIGLIINIYIKEEKQILVIADSNGNSRGIANVFELPIDDSTIRGFVKFPLFTSASPHTT